MKIKKTAIFLSVGIVMVFLMLKTDVVRLSVSEALALCVDAVIPTLFPFFVVSGIMVNSGIVLILGKILSPVSRAVFSVSGKGAVVFIIGILCGYPTGAKVIAEMCREGSLDKNEGERLLGFCNNSGPLFVIGAVGSVMLNNHRLGVLLYVIHFLSAVFVGVVFRVFSKRNTKKSKSEIAAKTIGEAVSKSIEDAVKSILNVCGYVVFFACICAMIKNAYLTSVLEVTTGAKHLIAMGLNEKTMLILLSGVIGFGGICVLLQVCSAVSGEGMSVKLYVLGKIIQALLSMLMMYLYLSLFDTAPVFLQNASTYKASDVPFVLFLICGVYTLVRLTKRGSCGILLKNKNER